ncbi:sensor domain-containing diguanylate cyclase [Shewanella sp. 10N.7]|uniref:sensor domain-containing diguanylate cyclase n=1 Tax=Shewanella sp. 10N.7 TaxID=2885093 RepID=UPI001E614ACB|nr:diguanylate cyclase [Shewanella sp. 10N.7]MCC4832280.1 sensor domain-containing diguanylate cyclase [Shewanella sp. 10N.7]
MKWIFTLAISLILGLNVCIVQADALHLSENHPEPIGYSLSQYVENDRLNASQAFELLKKGKFSPVNQSISNYGINAKPVWLHLTINNDASEPLNRVLHIDNYWLDEVSAFWIDNDTIVHFEHQGDLSLYYQQSAMQPSFNFNYSYPIGKTDVLIRVQTPDPMAIPVYLFNQKEMLQKSAFNNYSYGFLYGAITALLIYNFILFIGLRLKSYLFYSLYLGNFLLLHFAYSGHGSLWLWPNSPLWQQWSIPLLMVTFCTSGILFACHFLRLKFQLPTLNRILKSLCIIFPVLMLMAVMLQDRVLGLIFAFDLMLLFSGLMIVLGVLSLNFGNISARFFLIGSISSMLGIAVTCLAVWNYIPFNHFTYRAAEVGFFIDVLLLALALTERFRRVENEKNIAEKMANMDPLTRLNNRRAFYQLVEPMFAEEKIQKSASILMIDIDRFKGVNDTYGHNFGDEVLVKVATLIRDTLRKDDVLARWGGEEFIIFLPHTQEQEANTLAARLCENIAKLPFTQSQRKINVTASIGIVTSCSAINQLPMLIEVADKHLYQAKRSGRNQICGGLSPDVNRAVS